MKKIGQINVTDEQGTLLDYYEVCGDFSDEHLEGGDCLHKHYEKMEDVLKRFEAEYI